MIFDLVSILLVVLAIRGVVRASEDWRRRQPPVHRLLGAVGVLLRLLGVAMPVLAPALLIGWGWTWTWALDLALVIAGLTGLLAAALTLRLALLLRNADVASPHDQVLAEEGSHEASSRAPEPVSWSLS